MYFKFAITERLYEDFLLICVYAPLESSQRRIKNLVYWMYITTCTCILLVVVPTGGFCIGDPGPNYQNDPYHKPGLGFIDKYYVISQKRSTYWLFCILRPYKLEPWAVALENWDVTM